MVLHDPAECRELSVDFAVHEPDTSSPMRARQRYRTPWQCAQGKIAAPDTDNEANMQLVQFLSEALGAPRAAIAIRWRDEPPQVRWNLRRPGTRESDRKAC